MPLTGAAAAELSVVNSLSEQISTTKGQIASNSTVFGATNHPAFHAWLVDANVKLDALWTDLHEIWTGLDDANRSNP